MISWVLLALIRFYKRWISPALPPSCRYVPTCSAYMAEAITVHGPAKGVWLGTRRLCRCHPWGGHGWDPVPPRAQEEASGRSSITTGSNSGGGGGGGL